MNQLPSKRNYGIDLLRCIMMYGIAVHHCCCHTPFSSTFAAGLVFLLTVPSVDGFVAISGWFGMRFSVRKLLSLVGQILFYSFILTAASYCCYRSGIMESFLVSPGVGWFSQCYLALFCLSPLINAASNLSDIRKRYACVAVISALVVFDWLVSSLGVGGVPGFGSHTFGCFLLVYALVLLIAPIASNDMKFAGKTAACVIVISASAYVCTKLIVLPTNELAGDVFRWGGYNAPLVMLVAVSAVVGAASVSLPHWLERVVAFVTPSLFPVYLMHDAHVFGREIFVVRPLTYIKSAFGITDGISAAVIVLVWAFVVFSTTILIDIILRRLPLSLFNRYAAVGRTHEK